MLGRPLSMAICPPNFLKCQGGTTFIIDFEFAGVGNIYWDIMTIVARPMASNMPKKEVIDLCSKSDPDYDYLTNNIWHRHLFSALHMGRRSYDMGNKMGRRNSRKGLRMSSIEGYPNHGPPPKKYGVNKTMG